MPVSHKLLLYINYYITGIQIMIIIITNAVLHHIYDVVVSNHIVNSDAFVRHLRAHDLVCIVHEFLLRDVLCTNIRDQFRSFLPQNMDKTHLF